MNKYMSSLREREGASKKRPVRRTHSASRLVYGVESQCIKTADTPIILPVNKIVEQEDIVNNKIPLLISRPTMTELGFIIDAKIEEIKVDGTNCFEIRNYSIGSLQNTYLLYDKTRLSRNIEY